MSETVRKKGIVGYVLLAPAFVWLLLFFLIPFYSLLATSLFNNSGSDFRGYSMVYQWSNFSSVVRDYWPQMARSLVYGAIATFQCLILGYVLAYAIAFKAGRWKNFLLVLVIAPFFTSFLLRTLAWRTILADQGPVTSLLQTLHVISSDGRLLATPVAVIAGLVYNFMPFMTLPLYASLDKVDYRLVEAAGDLYASPFTGFRKVVFPLAVPGVVSGTLLTFIPACGDYINAELLGTPKQYMVGNRIQSAFLTEHNYPLAASLSLILMAVVVLMVVVYVRRVGTEELV
jgi:spermidine/putrescine transport system permease protein